MQYAGREGPDQRAVMHSDNEGLFWFKAIVPVPYPIPSDGPVGKLLEQLKRHCYRPSHMHFMFAKDGYDHLITYVLSETLLYVRICTDVDILQSVIPPRRPLRNFRRRVWSQGIPPY